MPRAAKMQTSEASRGKWKGILLSFGVDRSFLSGKHGPCPMCEGKDRFRFDDKEGKGTYFCSGCGAGSGFDLIQKIKGWDFRTAAQEIDKIVGNVSVAHHKQDISPERQREMLNRLWKGSEHIGHDDPVELYLKRRSLPLPQNRSCLRYNASCPVPGGAYAPAMIALISAPDGSHQTLHRTFLGPNGKAEMDEPRAVMPGTISEGAAIRLAEFRDCLGIAEGIETALAATAKFGFPVWAAINSTMLGKWIPPEGAKEIHVFGDNDSKYGGQAAAYALAHRLTVRNKLCVDVHIAPIAGEDWADIVARGAGAGKREKTA